MRYLIFFFALFFSATLSAKCVILPDNNRPGEYKIEIRTKARNAVQVCPRDDKGVMVTDIEETKVIQVEEDDLEKPIFEAKSKVTACADRDECFGLIEPVCDQEDPPNCVNYCDDISKEHFPIVAEDFTEVYCTKQLGFEKKLVDTWVFDPVARAAKQAQRDAFEQDKSLRDTKRAGRETTLIDCLNNPPGNVPDVVACQQAIIKNQLENKLPTDEL